MHFKVKSTQIYFDTYFPCIRNYWARPRGLQKIVYFNWGSKVNAQKSLRSTGLDLDQDRLLLVKTSVVYGFKRF